MNKYQAKILDLLQLQHIKQLQIHLQLHTSLSQSHGSRKVWHDLQTFNNNWRA